MWEQGQGSPECRAGWVGNSPQSPHPPSLGSNQSGRSTPSKQHFSFKVSNRFSCISEDSKIWKVTIDETFFHLNEIRIKDLPLLPDVEATLNFWTDLLLLKLTNTILILSTTRVFSVLYLQMGHRLLDPAPELVQKLTIVALGRMLHDVVDQVEQHQLLLDPYLKGNIVSEFLLLNFTFLMTFIQHLAILYADLLFLMHHPEKPCMDSWVSFKLTRIFMNFSSSNLSFSPALILRRSATAPPQHLASGRQDWLICHFTTY